MAAAVSGLGDYRYRREACWNMLVAYIRISTGEQNEARQYEDMKALNIEKYYVDKMSGATRERPGLDEMIGFVREGDAHHSSQLCNPGI